MKQHMQILINLLTKNDLKALLQHYQTSNESENITQLAFLFQQGQKNAPRFEFYQQLASQCIQSKGLPHTLIAQINNSDILSFFTPALQADDNFKKTNQQQRNVLHYLLIGHPSATSKTQPPFNYLRSMMLFESNETLHEALCQPDDQQLTPVEAYLFANQNLTALPDHEFTALLGLIEIQSKKQSKKLSKKQTVDDSNYEAVLKSVKQLCFDQSRPINNKLQRLLFIATYYSKPATQVLAQIS